MFSQWGVKQRRIFLSFYLICGKLMWELHRDNVIMFSDYPSALTVNVTLKKKEK